jgi:hypothetical protein
MLQIARGGYLPRVFQHEHAHEHEHEHEHKRTVASATKEDSTRKSAPRDVAAHMICSRVFYRVRCFPSK